MTGESVQKRALITGASAGIGEGFARRLAKRGYDLVLVARRRDRLDALAEELVAAGCEVLEADLASEAGVAAVEARLRTGDITLLVNNAGFGTVGEFASLPIARELEEIDVNVRALVRLCHAVLVPMVEGRSGAIINVASTAAYQPIPNEATYAATKAFVLHFTEALHEENRRHGVTVTAVCPGPVKTEFMEVAGIDDSRLPTLAWTSVDEVVSTALGGMDARRAVVIPGALNWMGTEMTRLMPRFMARQIAGALFREAGKN